MNKLIILILSFFVMTACGKKDDDGPSKSHPIANQNENIQVDGSNIDGIYAAKLEAVNYNLHLVKIGDAAIKREGDIFSAFVKMKFSPRATVHRQGIYIGNRCPRPADDLNKDAYVDIKEAMAAIGQVIIPLDGNLDSQQLGTNQNPVGDEVYGKYYYHVTGSFDRMFADLKLPDENSNDNMVKINDNEGISFTGKVILIQGMTKKITLPKTIATLPGQSPYESLPIACGKLWKVDKMPSDLKPEEIFVP